MQSQYKIKASFTGVENVVAGMKKIEDQIRRNTAALREQQKVSAQTGQVQRRSQQNIQNDEQFSQRRTRGHRTEQTVLQKRFESAERLYRFGEQTKQAWQEQISATRELTYESGKLLMAQARFKSLNLGPEETARGLKAVRDVVNQIPGTRLDEMTQSLTEMVPALGSLDHAIEVLPLIGKTQYISRALFGESPQKTEQEILSTVKALEQLGAVKLGAGGQMDMARFKEYYDTIIKIKAVTGGRVGGKELQNFAATSGLSGMGLTPQGLRNLVYIMQEMGGFRTGTALAAQFQSFVAFRQGAGGQRSFENLAKLGLIDMKRVRREKLADFTKEGRIKRLRPGAMPAADLLQGDPLKFAEVMSEALRTKGKAVLGRNIDVTNARDVGAALSQITGSRNAMNELGKLIVQHKQVTKDAEMAFKATSTDEQVKLADEATGKLIKFEAAVANLRAQVGIPLVEALGKAATAALPFVQVFAEYPKLSLFTLMLGRVAIGVSQTAIAFRTSGLASLSTSLQRGTSAVEQQATRSGSRIGNALTGAIKVAIVGFGVERLVSGLVDRAQGAVESRQSSEQRKDLEREREKAASTGAGADRISEIDKQIGALRAAELEASHRGGYLSGRTGSNFSQLVATYTEGYISSVLKGKAGFSPSHLLAPGIGQRQLIDQLAGGDFRFKSAEQITGFFETLRHSGQYSDEELKKLRSLASSVYPEFASALQSLSSAASEAASTLLRFDGKSVGGSDHGQAHGRYRNWTPPVGKVPVLARGGFVERGGLALIHSQEAIVPAHVTEGLTRRMTSRGSGIHLGGIHITVQGNATPGIEQKIARQIVSEFQQLLRESGLQGLTDDGFRDRALAI